MSVHVRALPLVLLFLIGAWQSSPVVAQEHPQLPSQQNATVRTTAEVPLQSLSPPGVERLRVEDSRRRREGRPYRYGKNIDTNFSPTQNGMWEQLPSGDWLWRLRLRSRDAVSLSIQLSPFDLPAGARLFLYRTDGEQIRGPYTASDATGGELWTPLVQSEAVTIELAVPQNRREDVNVVVGTVVHGYRALDRARTDGGFQKSGTCNLDVACEEADSWRNQIRSVGRYTVNDGGTQYACTGTLINNTAEDGRPLFLTAEHCVSTPSEAGSMVFYWNFETSTCRTQGTSENGSFADTLSVGNWAHTSTGALLRARYGNIHSSGNIAGKPDLALVEVDDAIPNDYDLYLSGWSRAGNTTQESVSIHHPAGHGKRISFDRNPSTLVDYPTSGSCPNLQAPSGTTHLSIQNWEVGTTESGSSGAPLFNTNQRIVGVLSGGCAGCGSDSDAQDNNAADWYGRIAPGFQNGDYTPPNAQTPTTLADILDPRDTGMETLNGRDLERDTIPPAPVSNFSVADATPDSVTLEWSAAGDDGTTGVAQRYEVRYRSQRPITTLAEFQSAQKIENPPRPKLAGTQQSVTVDVNQDTSYYFAIRAVDDANLASPLVATDRDVTPVTELRVTTPPSPNPARSQATARFVVEEEQPVQAVLYDALGRRVEVLLHETIPAYRKRRIRADVSTLSSGMYFLRIRGQSIARTERIAVVK